MRGRCGTLQDDAAMATQHSPGTSEEPVWGAAPGAEALQ
jgi:hypothetical protein